MRLLGTSCASGRQGRSNSSALSKSINMIPLTTALNSTFSSDIFAENELHAVTALLPFQVVPVQHLLRGGLAIPTTEISCVRRKLGGCSNKSGSLTRG